MSALLILCKFEMPYLHYFGILHNVYDVLVMDMKLNVSTMKIKLIYTRMTTTIQYNKRKYLLSFDILYKKNT